MDAYTLARATSAEDTARKWKAFAENLQRELQAVSANLAGMEALKDAAMTQLAKVDSNNYLLVQQNRQRIFDAAYEAVAKGKRAA